MITDIRQIVSDIVADMRLDGIYNGEEPYFMAGHRMEIAQRLREKNADSVFKYQKYPLIALKLPAPAEIGTASGNIREFRLNIAFIEFTNKNYISDERLDNVINPILEPMYAHFIEKCLNSSWVMENDTPPHTKIDRLFYGTEGNEGGEKYIFDDPLDAIELIDFRIRVIDKTCN